jgi:hypothetical protein
MPPALMQKESGGTAPAASAISFARNRPLSEEQQNDPTMSLQPPRRNKRSRTKSAPASITCSLPAMITPDPFATKKQMLDFITLASEGIIVRTSTGISISLRI